MRKVFKNGNSLAVTVPNDFAQNLKINEGTQVEWEKSEKGLVLIVEKRAKPATQIDTKVAILIDKISKKYSGVWQDLAKL